MKKILIISYFFSPSNFVGGDRITAWAKYLNQFGYYPTIITRNWNKGQKELTDKIEDNAFKHEVFDNYEIYRLPYKRTLRDKLNDYPKSKILTLVRKTLSYLELIFQNFFLEAIPYSNFFYFAKKLILKEKNFKCLIVSGRPFQLFSIASKLKKETNISWIADYRDEWNSFQNRNNKSILLNLAHSLEIKSELNWTSNATAFITVSEYWKKNISNFIQKKGYIVMNGFDKKIDIHSSSVSANHSKLEISYIGSLYAHQPIECFIDSMKHLILTHNNKIDFKINFIGLNVMPDQEQRVRHLVKDFENYFFFYERMSKSELKQFYENSDFLLATSFDNIKGWYPVKIFEYAVSGKPILLCPSDNDVLEHFIHETNAGISVNTVAECTEFLKKIISKKKNRALFELKLDIKNLEKYSREYQTKELAKVLDKF